MPRLIKQRSKKAGLSPGTLVHIGEKRAEKTRIRIIEYDEKNFQEREVTGIEECFPLKDAPNLTWINIDGIHQAEIIETLGKHFGLHPLLQEDILNTDQRPKVEDHDDHLFIVLKMLHYDDKKQEVIIEQVSIILGSQFAISLHEGDGDIFSLIQARIRNKIGRHRKMGADYLAYTLVDAIVDQYFIVLEKLGERIELIEEALVTNPTQETIKEIHTLKRELIFLRKSVWPLREVVNTLEREEPPLIHASVAPYLRDVYDHTIQVIDTIETFRDMVSGMLDIYLSSVSNKMNEVMKVLTVIATIFIPLTFIVGVYGMNFKYMPELEWSWGYFVIWGFMIVVALGMLTYFWKKKWL
jgi:magnesium transporter